MVKNYQITTFILAKPSIVSVTVSDKSHTHYEHFARVGDDERTDFCFSLNFSHNFNGCLKYLEN